jgi:hypothetical protein
MNFEQPNEENEKIDSSTIKSNVLEFLNNSFEDIEDENERKKEFDKKIEETSYDDFEKWLINLNGELRGISFDKRGFGNSVIGDKIGDISYLPPKSEDKKILLQSIFNSIKKVSNSTNKGALLYYAIQAIHLFEDGNGRTGRILYNYFRNNGKNLSIRELEELVGEHENLDMHCSGKEARQSFNNKVLDPVKAFNYFNILLGKEIVGYDIYETYFAGQSGACDLEIKQSSIKAEEVKMILAETNASNFPFNSLVAYKFLMHKNLFDEYAKIKNKNEDGSMIFIDIEELAPKLTEDDFDDIIAIHKDLKFKFIKKMSDIFENPEKYRWRMEDGSLKNVKDTIIIDSEEVI